MVEFADYGHAILSIVVVAFMAQVLNAATGIRKGARGLAPGERHPADYDDPSYRLDRAYMNSVETIGFFIALVIAAILAGANPFWVNALASLGVVLRILQNVLMLRGMGKAYGGIRTQVAALHAIVNLGLAGMAVWAVFA